MPTVKEKKEKNQDESGKIVAYRDPALEKGDVHSIVADEVRGEELCFRLCKGVLPECRANGRIPDVVTCK